MGVEARAPEELRRAEGLYFEDCGLVIRADDTVFRVSSHFLATQSTIFSDMLAIGTQNSAEQHDGCPLVHLTDSAEDFTTFLKALVYHDFFEPNLGHITMQPLSSILRMSDKYQVDALRRRAIAHLDAAHPITLAGKDTMAPLPLVQGAGPATLLEIATLARKLSLTWILPMAFYRLCRAPSARELLASALDPADILAILEARHALATVERSKILELFWEPAKHAGCPTHELCFALRLKARKAQDNQRFFTDGQVHLPLDLPVERKIQKLTLCCAVCQAAMLSANVAAREALWNKLPALFGLPEWDVLEQMKAHAMQ